MTDLLGRLKARFAPDDDAASIEVLERLRQMARRMDFQVPSSVPRPAPVTVRGLLATEPAAYASRRRRADWAGRLRWLLNFAFAAASAVNLFLLVMILLMWAYSLVQAAEPDPAIEATLGSGLLAVKAAPSQTDRGADEEPQQPEKRVAEPEAVAVTENMALKPEPQPEQAGADTTEPSPQLTRVPQLTRKEVDEHLATMLPEIGSGASGEPAPSAPRELGRAIRVNPSEATRSLRKAELGGLAGRLPGEIVVVTGEHDEVQNLLKLFKLPYRELRPTALATEDLSKAAMVVLNCGSAFQKRRRDGDAGRLADKLGDLRRQVAAARAGLPGLTTGSQAHVQALAQIDELGRRIGAVVLSIDQLTGPTRAALKLRAFVQEGGSLLTSDWGVTLLEDAFPGTVWYADTLSRNSTPLTIPSEARDHPLLRQTLLGGDAVTQALSGRTVRWEIDPGSHQVAVDEKEATVLAQGTILGENGAVAVTFRPVVGPGAPGRVLHLVSHIKIQQDKYGDFALQNLFLNVLLERVEAGPSRRR